MGNAATNSAAAEVVADGAMGVPEAVRFTGLSRAELYRLMCSGALAWLKHGRRRLIPRRALVELLAAKLPAARSERTPA